MKKLLLLFSLVIFLSGCGGGHLYNHNTNVGNIFNSEQNQNNVVWEKPIVQIVKIPATIRGGVYIPEHYEYVIIRPGEYILNVDPIIEKKQIAEKKIRNLYQIPHHIPVISPSGGDSVVLCFYQHNIPLEKNQNKILNIKEKPFLLRDIINCYGLYEKEPIEYKNTAYSVVYNDGQAILYWMSIDSEINKKKISSSDEALFNKDVAIVIKSVRR